MFLAPLPFEYVAHLDHHLDPGTRKRRAQSRPTGARVRRTPGTSKD